MANPRPLRVAVVDDERMTLAFVSDVLRSIGYQVRAYRSGEEALAALWDSPVDFVVVDLLLPRMSGVELVQELRRRPWAHQLAVVAISALSWSEEQAEHFITAMAPCRLLPKPVDMDELVEAAEALVTALASGAPPTPVPVAPKRTTPPPVATTLEVSLLNPREILREYTQNLIRDALFISTYAPLPRETTLTVRLSLPFRREPVSLQGQVVATIRPEDAAARTQGPGMALWLNGFPDSLKHELAAYVAGLRAFAPYSPPPKVRTVLLVGLQRLAPVGPESFLGRSDLKSVQARDLSDAIGELQRIGGGSVVIDGAFLGAQPLTAILELERAGADWIAVVASAHVAKLLGQRVEVIPSTLEPMELLQTLSTRLDGFARASARVSVSCSVAATRPDGSMHGTLRNLSLGGLMLVTEAPCAPGDRVEVDFPLPDGTGRIRAVASAIRVSRTGQDRSDVSVAMSFERIDPDSLDRLRTYLESRAGPEAYRGVVSDGSRAGL